MWCKARATDFFLYPTTKFCRTFGTGKCNNRSKLPNLRRMSAAFTKMLRNFYICEHSTKPNHDVHEG